MSVELQDSALKAKTGRPQWKVLALMTLYLVLAVTVGVVRSELQGSHAASAVVATQADSAR
jgi:hypothetical protein